MAPNKNMRGVRPGTAHHTTDLKPWKPRALWPKCNMRNCIGLSSRCPGATNSLAKYLQEARDIRPRIAEMI